MFQTTYGAIVIILATLDIHIMKSQYSRRLIYFYIFGFLLQLTAAVLWCIDNAICDQLEATRQRFMLLSPLTQLHGWWHVLAGYATYMHIIFCICHRQYFLKRTCHLQPHFFFGYTIKKIDDFSDHEA